MAAVIIPRRVIRYVAERRSVVRNTSERTVRSGDE